jgi:flavorubredoxin
VVKTGDKLNIGKKTLTFIETPMLHWPDSMMTYVEQDKLLISQDAFGQHLATASRFDDEFVNCQSMSELEDAVVDYYANILMPFGSLVKKKLDDIEKLGLEIDMIAPDHGIIWRKDIAKILQMYKDMANGAANLSVAIIYDTMWNSTELMAEPIMQGVKAEGVECKIIKLRATPMSIAIKEFWMARGTIIGSPTLNNILFPSVAEFLTHLRGLRPKARLMGAFGSHGWSGGAVREAYAEFEKMGLETVQPGVELVFKPSTEDKQKCFEFGREFARRVKEFHEKVNAAL